MRVVIRLTTLIKIKFYKNIKLSNQYIVRSGCFMKKKVIHILSHLKMGGAETLVTNYALNIDSRNFKFIIIVIGEERNTMNERKLKEKGIKLYFLDEKNSFKKSGNIFNKVLHKLHRHYLLRKLIKKEQPDVIHSHLYLNNYIAPLKTKRNNIKLYYTIHSDLKALYGKERQKNKMLTKYCIKRKGMIPIALHEKMQVEMNNLFNINNTLLLNNAVDVHKFQNVKKDKNEILDMLKIKKDTFIVGHIGRFHEVKNHDFLIRVFKRLLQSKPNSHLLLIGDGELKGKYINQINEQNIQSKVSFLGNRIDVPELMSIMDVFVFPSYHEGFGNVLIEAQAAGVKCVVSDTIPSETHLTDLIVALSLDESLENWYKEIAYSSERNNTKKNLEEYNIENVIKKLERLYYST